MSVWREVLFRGKSVDSGEWVYGGISEVDGHFYIVRMVRYIPDTRDWDTVEYYENNPTYKARYVEVDEETVGQYTGMNDKNGDTMIYDGDIIEIKERRFIVECNEVMDVTTRLAVQYESGSFMAVTNENNPYTYLSAVSNSCEVVGNIFDSYELLEH